MLDIVLDYSVDGIYDYDYFSFAEIFPLICTGKSNCEILIDYENKNVWIISSISEGK